MSDIEAIFEDLDADLTFEEFEEKVEEKVEQMGGLADDETAAMLVAHELGDTAVSGIADIEAGMEEVRFTAKVMRIGDLRTFERDDGDEEGCVINVEVADESGSIAAVFWNDQAKAVTNEIEEGAVLKIAGRPKDGYSGVEVNVNDAEVTDDVDITVDDAGRRSIGDLSLDDSNVHLIGRVLEIGTIRTFERDDGSEGRVSNISLGDESGRIRLTLWDEMTDEIDTLEVGETVEVIDGYVRERDGEVELHVGNRGAIEPSDEEIEYVPDSTPIQAVEVGDTVDLAGVVRSADPIRTFDRDDGSEGKVRNVRLQDSTGDIRIALWGEKADVDVAPGDEIVAADVEIQEGWQDDVEASAGWQSTITVLDDGEISVSAVDNEQSTNDRDAALDAFADTDADGETADSSGADEDRLVEGEELEFTGIVVQAGDPVVLDNGESTISVITDANVGLGEEVTARGIVSDGRLDANDVF